MPSNCGTTELDYNENNEMGGITQFEISYNNENNTSNTNNYSLEQRTKIINFS